MGERRLSVPKADTKTYKCIYKQLLRWYVRPMPPVIEEFRASPSAQRHMVAKHGVYLEEAIEAAESSSRHYRIYSDDAGERRYAVAGKTGDGRRLWVVFADEGGGRGRIIAAFEPAGRKDQTRHQRMRGD